MTKLTLENFADRENAANGLIRRDQVRRVEVEALVDTRRDDAVRRRPISWQSWASMRSAIARPRVWPTAAFRKLAFVSPGSTSRSSGPRHDWRRLLCPSALMSLIGQVQLEMLDLVVDPRSQEARPNPRSARRSDVRFAPRQLAARIARSEPRLEFVACGSWQAGWLRWAWLRTAVVTAITYRAPRDGGRRRRG